MTYVYCAMFFVFSALQNNGTKRHLLVNPEYEFHVQFIREVEKIYNESFTTLGISFKESMAL